MDFPKDSTKMPTTEVGGSRKECGNVHCNTPETEDLKRCTLCKAQWYCSKECQVP